MNGTLVRVGLSKRDLAADESVVVETHFARVGLLVPVACVVIACGIGLVLLLESSFQGVPLVVRRIAAAMFVAVAALWLLARFLRWRRRRLIVTTERLVVAVGSMRRPIDSVRLARVTEVHRRQSLGERILGRGGISLELIDGPGVALDHVRRPEALQRLILRQIRGAEEGSTPSQRLPERHETFRVVTELDPTPPRGTPAVGMSSAAAVMARLAEIDSLEADGLLSATEAQHRRHQLRSGG